jgi:hypothetical protein
LRRDDKEHVIPDGAQRRSGTFLRSWHELLGQVAPFGIFALDQRHLPFAPPALQFLLARNRGLDALEDFEIDQSVYVVTSRKALDDVSLVLEDAAMELVRDADVDRAVLPRRQDIDVEVLA